MCSAVLDGGVAKVDWLYAWGATGGPAGTCAEVDITPTSPRCQFGGVPPSALLETLQFVCPAVGTCLDFCRDIRPPVSTDDPAFCHSDGGIIQDGGTDINPVHTVLEAGVSYCPDGG